jgi:hypothetical protein
LRLDPTIEGFEFVEGKRITIAAPCSVASDGCWRAVSGGKLLLRRILRPAFATLPLAFAVHHRRNATTV